MRKTRGMIALLLCLALSLVLTGCGETEKRPAATQGAPAEETPAAQEETEKPEETPAAREETEGTENAETGGSDVLVVYFSRTGEQYRVGVIETGNTAIVADMIAQATGADVFEILPEDDDRYPMTYSELTDAAKKEQRENARPAYAGEAPELGAYNTIFIGAPVWWGDWPMIMYTFFESMDLSGKKLVPFSTHEGSGLSGFDRKLAGAAPEAEVLKGLAIRGQDCQNDQDSVRAAVSEWLAGLGF